MIMETMIKWANIQDSLPDINRGDINSFMPNEENKGPMILSDNVLITDGYCIEYGQYIFNWNKYRGLNDHYWATDTGFIDAFHWCYICDVNLPFPPKRIDHIEMDTSGKYTLKQLRQAWAAGKFSNQTIIKCVCP